MIKVSIKPPTSLGNMAKAQRDQILGQALHAIGTYGIHQLTKMANDTLSPLTAQSYIHGLQAPDAMEVKGNKLTITLVGDLPNALELGSGSYDLKAKMLAKAKKHTKSGDPIVDVPFEHGAPGATGKPAMPRMEYNIMQAHIRLAKAKLGPVRGPKVMPTRPTAKMVKLPGENRAQSYTPKAGPYDSMLALGKGKRGGGGKERRYLTIRRISRNSDPSSWIHPGYPGISLFDKIAKELEQTGARVIQDYLDHL